jgi:hypothetical protein
MRSGGRRLDPYWETVAGALDVGDCPPTISGPPNAIRPTLRVNDGADSFHAVFVALFPGLFAQQHLKSHVTGICIIL